MFNFVINQHFSFMNIKDVLDLIFPYENDEGIISSYNETGNTFIQSGH